MPELIDLDTDRVFCNCDNDDPDCPECFGENWDEDMPIEIN